MLYDITDAGAAGATLRRILGLSADEPIPAEVPAFEKGTCPLAYRRALGDEGLWFRAKHITTCKDPGVFRKYGILPLGKALNQEDTDIADFLLRHLQIRCDAQSKDIWIGDAKHSELTEKLRYDNRVNGYMHCADYYYEFDLGPEFLRNACERFSPKVARKLLSQWKGERKAYEITFDVNFKEVNSTSLYEAGCEEEDFYSSLASMALKIAHREPVADQVITLIEGIVVPPASIVEIHLL